jgi:dCTP deaminase
MTMILSDRDIKDYLKRGTISITPKPDLDVQLGACSIDLRLGDTFRIFEHSKFACIDPHDPDEAKELTTEITVKEGEPFILQPSDFVLATTIESFSLPDDLVARLEGRSSLGRLGIVVHSTASVFEPGWRGKVVMELGNMGRMPVMLYPGMRVCALTFEQLSCAAQVPYNKKKNAKYVNQNEPLASKIALEKI